MRGFQGNNVREDNSIKYRNIINICKVNIGCNFMADHTGTKSDFI